MDNESVEKLDKAIDLIYEVRVAEGFNDKTVADLLRDVHETILKAKKAIQDKK